MSSYLGGRTRPRRRWRWWHILLLVIGTPVALFAMWIALVVASFSGGFDDLFDGDPPREGDPKVVAARQDASRDLSADADRLTVAVITPALSGSARSVGRGEVTPPCQEGQHNWKIDDDFDLACDLSRVEVVAVAQQGAFRAEMVALDSALRADGWTSDLFGMDRVLVDYRDQLSPAAAPEPGTASVPSARHGYSMDDLPAAQYTKSIGGGTRTLAVRWAEPGSLPQVITYVEDQSTFRSVDGQDVEPAALIDAIPAKGYAVVVTESVEYFNG